MLSIKRYSLLCILGGEIVYTLCMAYGLFLTGKPAELHLAIFQLFPGFTGMNFGSWFIGAVTVAFWSGLSGAYISWMHNYSIKQ
ncbi:MAG: hypothetical protein HYW71_03095 [Candidatus Niyogibacteria bacterium]|nr:hypothetical protein [Candidatus Niyogibacteria bacterium]